MIETQSKDLHACTSDQLSIRSVLKMSQDYGYITFRVMAY